MLKSGIFICLAGVNTQPTLKSIGRALQLDLLTLQLCESEVSSDAEKVQIQQSSRLLTMTSTADTRGLNWMPRLISLEGKLAGEEEGRQGREKGKSFNR